MKKQVLVPVAVGAASLSIAAGAFLLVRAKAGPASASPARAPIANSTPTHPEAMLNEPILPIRVTKLDERKVALGKKLFQDVRLSGDNTISCNSCHILASGGMDGKVHSFGINGAEGDVNAPTVLNSGLNFKQFWDGRADTLEEQVEGPTHNPKEMGSSWNQIIQKLTADSEYPGLFGALYPAGIQSQSIKDAIATFERSLITPDSRFDRYLRGEKNAINDEERKGYQYFKDLGCISCHQGMNAGGNMFQPFGVMADYFADRGNQTQADQGRFNVTGLAQDRHRFRVPGLRNVELTAPYFHDGSAGTLSDAVKIMAKYQLSQDLTDEQVDAMVAFLKTLTGEQPAR